MPIILNCSPGTGDKKINGRQKSIRERNSRFILKLAKNGRNFPRNRNGKEGKARKMKSFISIVEFFAPPDPISVTSNSNWRKNLINCFTIASYLHHIRSYNTQKRVKFPLGNSRNFNISRLSTDIVLVVIASIRFRLKSFVNDNGRRFTPFI